MNTTQTRATLLAQINSELAARNLKPLAELGDHTHGQIELTSLHAIFDHSARFFTDVQFTCIFPNGTTGLYAIRWNANSLVSDGAVMVVVINGRLAMVRQHRPALGAWTTELPRGFGENVDKTTNVGDLPIGAALRELYEEVVPEAQIDAITRLGVVAQDSSTHTATPAYWLIEVSVDAQSLNERLKTYTDEGIALQLWTVDKAFAAVGTKITDAHSIVGLALYRHYLEHGLTAA
jgi:hypothetical protein